jgi:ubiquitin carboxyl-terminal hydrolase 4/11/15
MAFVSPKQEQDLFLKVHNKLKKEGDLWYLIDKQWFNQWKGYVRLLNFEGEKVKVAAKPGPIDNKALQLKKNVLQPDLLVDEDYLFLKKDAWSVLFKLYKGGPVFERYMVSFDGSLGIELYPADCTAYLLDEFGEPDPATKHTFTLSRCFSLKQVEYRIRKVMGTKSHFTFSVRDLADPDSEAKLCTATHRKLFGHVCADENEIIVAVKNSWRTELRFGSMVDVQNAKKKWFEATVEKLDPQEEVDEMGNPKQKLTVHIFGTPKSEDFAVMSDHKRVQPHGSKTKNWRVFDVGDAIKIQRKRGPPQEGIIQAFMTPDVMLVKMDDSDRVEEVSINNEQIAEPPQEDNKKDDSEDLPDIDTDILEQAHTKSVPGRIFPGAVGFQNLGNTCFMNSINQCLSNMEPYAEYLLKEKHVKEINEKNFLGSGGKVIRAWQGTLVEIWSGQFQKVVPRSFKDEIGKCNETFAGYNQQDAQEYLAFICDVLHEDCNRVIEKPATGAVETMGRADQDISDEVMGVFRMRNDSILVDLTMGLTRSALCCTSDDCDYKQPTFDIYSILSVPLPLKATLDIFITVVLSGKPPVQCMATVRRDGNLRDLIEWVAVNMAEDTADGKLTPFELIMAETFGKRFYRFFDLYETLVAMIETEPKLFMYQVAELDFIGEVNEGTKDDDDAPKFKSKRKYKENSAPPEFIVQCLHIIEDTKSVNNIPTAGRTHLAGTPLLFSIPIKATNAAVRKMLWDQMGFQATEEDASEKDLPYKAYLGDYSGCVIEDEIPNNEELFEPKQMIDNNKVIILSWIKDKFDPVKLEFVPNHKSVPAKKKVTDDDAGDDAITIEMCIDMYVEDETMDEYNWECAGCKRTVHPVKTYDIFTVPQVLIFQLKRFAITFTEAGMQKSKIESLVRFPLKGLDMARWCKSPTQLSNPKGLIFDLYGVSNHIGGTGGGHYTAYCLNFRNTAWYSLNDAFANDCEGERTQSKFAYLIFYIRRFSDRDMAEQVKRVAKLGKKKKKKK